ncbi:6692_t:CDS:2, partial [Funneliformis geosporum]
NMNKNTIEITNNSQIYSKGESQDQSSQLKTNKRSEKNSAGSND